jgi:hypothetical protein
VLNLIERTATPRVSVEVRSCPGTIVSDFTREVPDTWLRWFRR